MASLRASSNSVIPDRARIVEDPRWYEHRASERSARFSLMTFRGAALIDYERFDVLNDARAFARLLVRSTCPIVESLDPPPDDDDRFLAIPLDPATIWDPYDVATWIENDGRGDDEPPTDDEERYEPSDEDALWRALETEKHSQYDGDDDPDRLSDLDYFMEHLDPDAEIGFSGAWYGPDRTDFIGLPAIEGGVL